MHIRVVSPSLGEPTGNAQTAQRWSKLLAALGHTVTNDESGPEPDLLVAIHARKSAHAVRQSRESSPDRPIVLLLSGTDLYGDLAGDPVMRSSVESADRLIVLHERGVQAVPSEHRSKVSWIPQSVVTPTGIPPRPDDRFRVVVASNLRSVKDPLRTLAALDHLPHSSTIEVIHVGLAINTAIEARALQASSNHDRYTYLGPAEREATLRHIGSSHLLSLTSELEGGANVLSEAIVLGTPIICTRIPGNLGILGDDYPGYFATGDSQALADLLSQAETDPDYYQALRQGCEIKRGGFDPEVERTAWSELLQDLT